MFEAVTSEAILQLFQRGAKALVHENDDGHVVAYIVHERTRLDEPVLHYLWVRDGKDRGKGLALDLLRSAGIDPNERFFYTFRTRYTRKPLFKNGTYEPSIARRKAA
jgi:hypothetical protein